MLLTQLKSLAKALMLAFRVDWIDTLRINLCHLPFRQGRKLPILLFKAKLHIMQGASVRLNVKDEDCRFGMIKLGCQYSKNVLATTGVQIDLRTGGLVFNGAGIMGCGSNVITRKGGTIVFGKNFRVSGNFSICAFQKIEIGNNLSCSWNVSIYDTDFHETIDFETGQELPMTRSVVIGNNCWLCQKSTILKGVCLPDWSVVGACALVNKSYEDCLPYTLFAGTPAKPLKKRIVRTDQKTIVSSADWKVTFGLHLLNQLSCEEKSNIM